LAKRRAVKKNSTRTHRSWHLFFKICKFYWLQWKAEKRKQGTHMDSKKGQKHKA